MRGREGKEERKSLCLFPNAMQRNLLVEEREISAHLCPRMKAFDSWKDNKDFIIIFIYYSMGADDYRETQYRVKWKCFSQKRIFLYNGNQVQVNIHGRLKKELTCKFVSMIYDY